MKIIIILLNISNKKIKIIITLSDLQVKISKKLIIHEFFNKYIWCIKTIDENSFLNYRNL